MAPSKMRVSHEEDPIHRRADGAQAVSGTISVESGGGDQRLRTDSRARSRNPMRPCRV